jgi:hypothetical protein
MQEFLSGWFQGDRRSIGQGPGRVKRKGRAHRELPCESGMQNSQNSAMSLFPKDDSVDDSIEDKTG